MERIKINQLVEQYTLRLSNRWKWFIGIGVLLMVLGLVALGNQLFATMVSIYFISLMLLSAGIIQIIEAFHMRVVNRALYLGGSGLLYSIAGVLIFFQPVFTSVVLTLFLASLFIIAGIMRLWDGFKYRDMIGSAWTMFSGFFTLVFGLMVAISWPENSLWIIGIMLGVDLLFQGWVCLDMGFAIKRSPYNPDNQA